MKIFTISPSWLISRSDFLKGVRTLGKMGFEVVNKSYVPRLPGPEGKAREIEKAFADKKIGLVLARRGGYSAVKVLPHLNFGIIKKNPKLLAGFSDLSALLNPVFERTGLVTLHSPMVINFDKPSRFTVGSFKNALAGFPGKNLFEGAPVAVYNPGKAKGTLKGGNLVTLTALIGSEWELKALNSILFFEDVDEKPHQVDRYLTQWILSGRFKGIKGLILGDFRGVNNRGVYDVISRLCRIDFPVVHCPYIGHVRNKITLPIGAKVTLDTRSKSLLITGGLS
jgi:muramoyltetrapeptide carboxypeptidase